MSIEIVAELAQGFEGSPEQARLMVKAAATAGADAAKFQLVYADELATPDYKYYKLFRSLEMTDEVWAGLATYAKELGIHLQLDVFGSRSLALAVKIGVSEIKLHGTDINNLGLLTQVAASPVSKVLLGAGGALASEIQQAVDVLKDKQVLLLLGYQGYPTPVEGNQIERVRFMTERYKRNANVIIGFADHAEPDSPCRYALAAAAVGAGAKVLEKHLTLGRIMKLEDHEAALNPDEFLEFTQTLRACDVAMGTTQGREDFGMSESELGYRKMIRRHVVTSRALTAGASISPADVILKRTSSEQIISDLKTVYRKTLKRDIAENHPILPRDIDG